MRSTALIFHTLLSLVSVNSAPRAEPSFECSEAARADDRVICNAEGLPQRSQFGGQISASAKRAIRDRREERRRTHFRQGKLFTASGKFLSQCTICDRSENGARVRVDKEFAPQKVVRFTDDVDNIVVEAKVAWQRGNELGLAFLTTAKSAKYRAWASASD
jgi:hypothetical protein